MGQHRTGTTGLIPALAAVSEWATGLALIAAPSLVVRLLLGADAAGVAIPIARMMGVALVALGVSCWPGSGLTGMLTYGALATVYLAWVRIEGQWVGPLLWPAVLLHTVLTVLLARCWLERRRHAGRPIP